MIVLLTAAGQTASLTFTPKPGFRWILVYCSIELSAGATVGSRSLNISRINTAELFANIPTQTGVSANYYGDGGITNTSAAANHVQFSDYPVITVWDGVSLYATLLSGDSYTYRLMFDEVPDT